MVAYAWDPGREQIMPRITAPDSTSAVAVSFNGFVVSLATTAAVHFGDVADPGSGAKGPANLAAAGQAIAMLALLEEKTRGNLTDHETRFLRQVLHELRLRLAEAHKTTPGATPVGGAPSAERGR